MDYQSLHNMTVVELRKLAKERQVKPVSYTHLTLPTKA